MATIGADLVRQMAAGDREAFAVFYDRYAPVVFPLILRIVRERADASDVSRRCSGRPGGTPRATTRRGAAPKPGWSRARARAPSIASDRRPRGARRSWRPWTRPWPG